MGNLVFFMFKRGFGMNMIRDLFAMLDSVAFFLFSKVMQLMFDIVNFTNEAPINELIGPLQRRLYVIVSIYMLFKVTVSLITYLVNPDTLTDKSQGVGKLVQRIIVSMVMLIFFPYAFTFLNKVQADIINAGTIPKLVLGTTDAVDSPEGVGTMISYNLYNGTFVYQKDCSSSDINGCKVPEDQISELSVSGVTEVINEPSDNSASEYKYGYIIIVGFLVGMLLTIVTLGMCVDVAMRVFKLIILQMIAPIPILSYIDPKSSKDGAFSKWIKMTISVWADIFLRLFIIYFILLIIERLIQNAGSLVSTGSVFVNIALIIGLLFFAKDAPKFIYDSLGMKAPDRGLFAGIGNMVAAGAVAGGALGGMIGLGYANATRPIDDTDAKSRALSYARNIGGALFGGASGAIGGLVSGAYAAGTAKDHAAKAALDARNKYMTNSLTGNNLGARASRMGQNLLLGYDIDREISRNQAIESTAKDLREYSANEGAKVFSDIAQDLNFTNATGHRFDFNSSMDDLQQAYSSGATTGDYVLTDIHGVAQHLSKSEMDKLMGDASDGMGNMLMDAVDGTNRGAAANYSYADVAAAYTAKTSQTKRDVHSSNISSKRSSYGGSARLSDSQTRNERAATIKGRQYGASNEAARLKVIKGDRK